MTVQFNPQINLQSNPNSGIPRNIPSSQEPKSDSFGNKILESLNKINDQHQDANASILDLMTGKQQDINSVVASVAKADMSFKLLVGVRNKLVEAYKETMRMQI
jgi:flagellar hook-basal body complex protein FliE